VSNDHDFVSHSEEECEEGDSCTLPPTMAMDIKADLAEEPVVET
jgi:hypothetical protein